MQEILNEKYRPKEFEEVIGLDSKIPEAVDNQDIPHMLFIGPPGTGKTTTARIIARKLDAEVLLLNASKERGIDTIRDRIEPFAMKISDKIKIVFLDEFDATTPAFQTALRNFLEQHSLSTRFIATCNYVNKIIEPLRSRFAIFKFAPTDAVAIKSHLEMICSKEGIIVEPGALDTILRHYKTDIRSMINILNKSKGKQLKNTDILKEDVALKLLAMSVEGKWMEMRQLVLDNSVDHEELLEQMDSLVFANPYVSIEQKRRANILFADSQFKMNFSFNKEIVFASMLGQLIDIMKAKQQ